MPVITLTSDWKRLDFYCAAVKGRLMQMGHDKLVDITHEISSFNVGQAAFIVRNAYHHFPEGSIHLILVRTELSSQIPLLAARVNGHYFITADNGFLGLLYDVLPEEVVKADIDMADDSFPELIHFTDIAHKIASGTPLSDIGGNISNFRHHVALKPTFDVDEIVGNIIYIDSYENVFTNISKKLFDDIGMGRKFTIYVKTRFDTINELSNNESVNNTGDLVAIFNSLNLLEIAVYNGRIAELLNLELNNNIRIKFHNEFNE